MTGGHWRGWSLAERGDVAEGIACGETALQIAEGAEHTFSLIVAAAGLGSLYVFTGDLPKAIPLLQRGLVLDQVAELPLLYPFVASPLGVAYARSGRAAEALWLSQQAVDQAASMNLMANQSLRITWLGEAQVLAGRRDGATESARRALGLSREQKERGHEAYALRLLGEIGSHRDPPDAEEVHDYYRQALALARELGMRPLTARCLLELGTLFGRTGDRARAREHLGCAVQQFRGLDMSCWLAQSEAELAALG